MRASLLVCTLVIFAASPVYGQPDEPEERQVVASDWRAHFGEQLAVLLKAPWKGAEEEVMMLILQIEQQPETAIDYKAVVPRLFEIYERDPHDGRRLLALAALNAIGTPDVLEELARRVPYQASDRVRQQTLNVLTARAEDASAGR